ncbi:hypothetical protein [Paracoccus lutimaris]|uniref:Uncharacterized protein n=1 Tax=Paracoccus lutimaris TaxID=1490030 RepID=A0A368YGM3_9RHOB|nr:hypothetical protein [Paracoccus lutimaris]RCW78027.1 hypothetical protein DFP89_1488 [Paracoccus lutimaris]
MGQASQEELRSEARTATLLFFFALTVLVLGVIAFLLWGLPALTMIGLAATAGVYGMLVAYAAGL